MSGFHRRWRRLARAASSAGDPPVPPAPDGARLLRLARTAPSATASPWAHPFPSALALALLWAVALPALEPAWRSLRARLPVPAPAALGCCGSWPRLPSPPGVPGFARPRVPKAPEAAPCLPGLPRWLEASCKERAS